MRLSDAELKEGWRLLEESRKQQAIDRMGIAATVWNIWVSDHADALLGRHEEIAREAVREFASALIEVTDDEESADVIHNLACDRGVILCADCRKPDGVCECVKPEPCPKCGKGACRCEP